MKSSSRGSTGLSTEPPALRRSARSRSNVDWVSSRIATLSWSVSSSLIQVTLTGYWPISSVRYWSKVVVETISGSSCARGAPTKIGPTMLRGMRDQKGLARSSGWTSAVTTTGTTRSTLSVGWQGGRGGGGGPPGGGGGSRSHSSNESRRLKRWPGSMPYC